MTQISSNCNQSMNRSLAHIRGRLITRWEEKPLGWATLDSATADMLGREQLGWFVGNHPGIDQAARQIARLDTNPAGGVWVVVPHSRQLACELFAKWPHADHVVEPPSSMNYAWRSRNVWFAIPEDLRHLLRLARDLESQIAGVIILDPDCIIYRARGGTDTWGHIHSNDRPQHVVNFRASLSADGWQPPLLLLTNKPAKSITTDVVARAFCLNGFRFIAGKSFGIWDEPVDDVVNFDAVERRRQGPSQSDPFTSYSKLSNSKFAAFVDHDVR